MICLWIVLVACRSQSSPKQEGVVQEEQASGQEGNSGTGTEGNETEGSNNTSNGDSGTQDPDEQDTDPQDDTQNGQDSQGEDPDDNQPDDNQVYSDPNSELCHDEISNWPSDWFLFEEAVLEEVNIWRAQGADCGTQGYFEPTQHLVMDPDFRCASRYHAFWMSENNIFIC